MMHEIAFLSVFLFFFVFFDGMRGHISIKMIEMPMDVFDLRNG